MIIVLIVLFGFILRVVNLISFPIFTDESIYIYWAELLTSDLHTLLLPVWDGKTPLYIWFVSLLLKLHIPYLFAGRIVSVIAGIISIILIYKIGIIIQNKKIGYIAAILLAINPFVLFYDRMALMDSLMTLFGLCAFYFSYKFIKSKKIIYSVLTGISLGFAFLSKPSGSVFILFIGLIWIYIKKIKELKTFIIYSAITGSIYLFLSNTIRISSAFFRMELKNQEFLLSFSEFIQNPFQLIEKNILQLLLWLLQYNSILLLVLIFLPIILFVKKTDNKHIFVLYSFYTISILGICTFGKVIFPRYFTFTMPYLILIISTFLFEINHKFPKASTILFIIIGSIWLYTSYVTILYPTKLTLPFIDKDQYITGRSSGFGINQIYETIDQKLTQSNLIIVTDNAYGLFPYALELRYRDQKNSSIFFLPTWEFDSKFDIKLTNLKKRQMNSKVLFIFKDKVLHTFDQNLIQKYQFQLIQEINKPENKSSFLLYESR